MCRSRIALLGHLEAEVGSAQLRIASLSETGVGRGSPAGRPSTHGKSALFIPSENSEEQTGQSLTPSI